MPGPRRNLRPWTPAAVLTLTIVGLAAALPRNPYRDPVERSARSHLERVVKLESLYFAQHERFGSWKELLDAFPRSVEVQGAALDGYSYALDASRNSFVLVASPVRAGHRGLYTDETGTIYASESAGTR